MLGRLKDWRRVATRDDRCHNVHLSRAEAKMKLFGIALVCVLSFSTKAIAATEFGLTCIQTMFQSRNDFLG